MANTNTLIDSFARFNRNLYGEIGSLLGDVLGKQLAPAPAEDIEGRIMKAVDERFTALEQKVLSLVNGRLSGQKRKQPDTPPCEEEDEEEEVAPAPSSNGGMGGRDPHEEVAPAPVEEAAVAPVAAVPKGQMLITQFAPQAAEVAAITNALEAVSLKPKAVAEEEEEEEAEEDDTPDGSSVAEEEEDDTPDGSSVAKEEEEEAEEEEEEAELTPFKYKGKDYYMDGDCNVYSVNEEGELIEDPVGIYDEKTRRITFNS